MLLIRASKKISVQDADVSEMRDSFLSESFIEDTTTVTIDENSTQTFKPTNGFEATKKIIVEVNVPGIVPSGTLTITDNGTKDVKNYAEVNVNVEPNLEQKTVTITENGTTEVTPTSGKDGISKVTINTKVPSSGGVEEVATTAAMNALLVEANVGKYYKFIGPTDSNYTNGNLYLVESSGYTVNYTNNANSAAPAYILINGGPSVKITEVSGTFENVQTIQFVATRDEASYATTIKSTTLGLNISGNDANTTSKVYTLTQDVTDVEISWIPYKTSY